MQRLCSSQLSPQSAENFQNLGSLRSHLLAILAFYTANIDLAVAGSARPVPLPLYNMRLCSLISVQPCLLLF